MITRKPTESRLAYLLRVAIRHIFDHAADDTTDYDETDCDGSCLAGELQNELDDLTEKEARQARIAEALNLTQAPAKAEPAATTAPAPLPALEIVKEEIDMYYTAYSSRTGSIARDCKCGKTYYNADRPNDFDPGELEGYRNNPNAFHVDYEPGGVYVLGIEYCNACDCWHRKAQQIVNMLIGDKLEIGHFYRLYRESLEAEARTIPVI